MGAEDYSDLIAAAKGHKGEDYSDLISAAGGPKRRSYAEPKSITAPEADLGEGPEYDTTPTGLLGGLKTFHDRVERGLPRVTGALNSAIDRASFGGLTGVMRLSNKINEATGREPAYGQTLSDISQYREEHPTLSQWTDAPAYFTGPTNKVVGATDAVVRAAESKLPTVIKAAMNAVPRQTAVVRNMLTAGGAGATIAGANALTAGEPGAVPEAMSEGAQTGAALSVPLSVGAAAIGGTGRAITESKGGEARRFIEERGGNVGMSTPGEGKPFENMSTTKHGDEGIGEQGEVSAERGLNMLREENKGIRAGLGIRKAKVSNTPEARNMRDVSDLVLKMREAIDDIDTSPQAEQSLKSSLDKIRKQQGQHFNEDTDTYLLSESDLNKLRRRLDRDARTGVSTDEKLHPLKDAANLARSMVSEGPYADVNKSFAEEASRYQKSRKQLGINQKTRTPEETKGAINTVKHLITRRGQGTITSGGQQANLRAFEEAHPDIAEEFQKPELLRKREDISFRLFPEHGGIHKTLGPIGHMVAHSLLTGGTGILPALALTNRNALAARLLYGPALAAQAAEPLLLGEVPQIAAARAMQEERR